MITKNTINEDLSILYINHVLYDLILLLKQTNLYNTLEFAEFTYETFEKELLENQQKNIN